MWMLPKQSIGKTPSIGGFTYFLCKLFVTRDGGTRSWIRSAQNSDLTVSVCAYFGSRFAAAKPNYSPPFLLSSRVTRTLEPENDKDDCEEKESQFDGYGAGRVRIQASPQWTWKPVRQKKSLPTDYRPNSISKSTKNKWRPSKKREKGRRNWKRKTRWVTPRNRSPWTRKRHSVRRATFARSRPTQEDQRTSTFAQNQRGEARRPSSSLREAVPRRTLWAHRNRREKGKLRP